MLMHDSHACVQVYVYCCTPRRDAKSAHLRSTAEAAGCVWRSVASMHEQELAQLIRDDAVDVLIELTGARSRCICHPENSPNKCLLLVPRGT